MPEQKYTILPFQFKRTPKNDVHLVNKCGDYTLINNDDFSLFVNHRLEKDNESFSNLKSHLFLATDDLSVALRQIAARYSTRKSFLRDFTVLHMMVITHRCNQRCEYCQVSYANENAMKSEIRYD